jgi:hypothetical protein
VRFDEARASHHLSQLRVDTKTEGSITIKQDYVGSTRDVPSTVVAMQSQSFATGIKHSGPYHGIAKHDRIRTTSDESRTCASKLRILGPDDRCLLFCHSVGAIPSRQRSNARVQSLTRLPPRILKRVSQDDLTGPTELLRHSHMLHLDVLFRPVTTDANVHGRQHLLCTFP